MSNPYRVMESRRPCDDTEHDLGDLLVHGEPMDAAQQCARCGMVRLFGWDGWTDWFDPRGTK